jgi:hypothetical protein
MPTEDPLEHKLCMQAFEQYARPLGLILTKRKKKVLAPGEGRYLNPTVDRWWQGWRAAWDYLNLGRS